MGADRSDFGTKLRAARERKGVSLRQIANRTKISMTILEALERNDITRLPGGIFSRAFVRSYANEVGLDPENTIQEFIAQFPQDSVTAGHPRSDQVEDTELFESDRRVARSVLWILLISIPLAGGVLYLSVSGRLGGEPASRRAPGPDMAAPAEPTRPADTGRPGSRGPSAAPSGAGAPAAVPGSVASRSAMPRTVAPAAPPGTNSPSSPAASGAPAATPAAAPATSTGGTTAAPARAVAPTAATASAASASASGAPAEDRLTIVLSARRPVWVSATADGQKAIGRLLQTGEQETVEVRRELTLTAGDAAAVKMTVNGAEARSLGKTGEVVTARVTLANFKDYLQNR